MTIKTELITAEYLKKLSLEGSKVNVKVNEILKELVGKAENGETSYSIYLNEEYDGFYEMDIEAIEKALNEKGFKVSIELRVDYDDGVNIWEVNVSW